MNIKSYKFDGTKLLFPSIIDYLYFNWVLLNPCKHIKIITFI